MTDTRTQPANDTAASNDQPTAADDTTGRLSTADLAGRGASTGDGAPTATGNGAPTATDDATAEGRIQRPPTPDDDRGGKTAPLFDDAAANDLRDRWTDVQTGFVDEPRSAVEGADALVAEVMKRLADGFATERQALEAQWSRGDDVSTEDLRVALRRYRSFFDRLLSI